MKHLIKLQGWWLAQIQILDSPLSFIIPDRR